MKAVPSKEGKIQVIFIWTVLILIVLLICSPLSSAIPNHYGRRSVQSSSDWTPPANQQKDSIVQGNVTNLSSNLSSLLAWGGGEGVIGNQLVITGGDNLVNISLADPTSPSLLRGTTGYTQFTQSFGSSLLVGGTDGGHPGGVLLYSVAPGAEFVQSLNYELPTTWTEQGSYINLMSMSGGGNYTFMVVEQNGNSNGTAPPQMGLLNDGSFSNITSAFPIVPASGAGYYSAYGGGDFLLLTAGYGYLYNTTTGLVTNVSSLLHGNFSPGIARFLPSAVAWDNGQFLIAYSTELVSFDPLTQSVQTLFSVISGSILSFVVNIGNETFIGEVTGSSTEVLASVGGSTFRPFAVLWGSLTDIIDFDNSFWTVGTAYAASHAVLYVLANPTLSVVKVSPSSDELGVEQYTNFSATAMCSEGPFLVNCPTTPSYSWSLSNGLGELDKSVGPSVTFVAGPTIGNLTLFVNATLDGTTVQSLPVTIQIALSVPTISSVVISPTSSKVNVGDSVTFNATPNFGGMTGPPGTTLVWSLTNDLGFLNDSRGSSVEFSAGKAPGNDTLSVNATLNGKTVQSIPVTIAIVITPNSVQYQPYVEIPTSQTLRFNLTSTGPAGLSYGAMNSTLNISIYNDNSLAFSTTIAGMPTNYSVIQGSDSYGYFNFNISGGAYILVKNIGDRIGLFAFNCFNYYISSSTASLIMYPAQFGLSIMPYNMTEGQMTGISTVIQAPNYQQPIPLAILTNGGGGSGEDSWFAQIGLNTAAFQDGSQLFSYPVLETFSSLYGSFEVIDYNYPLTPGDLYNFTLEVVKNSTWEFMVDGQPIQYGGFSGYYNATPAMNNMHFGLETDPYLWATSNSTTAVYIPTVFNLKINGVWTQPGSASFTPYVNAIGENWYNGQTPTSTGISLWGMESNLQNNSVQNNSLMFGDLLPNTVVSAIPISGVYQDPLYGTYYVNPENQGSYSQYLAISNEKIKVKSSNETEIVSLIAFSPQTDKVIKDENYILKPGQSITLYKNYSNIIVAASDLSNNVIFEHVISPAPKMYNLSFRETGLPSGTIWYVNISNGHTFSSNSSKISFSEPNGTYTYTLATVNKQYSPITYSDIIAINGSNITQTVTFKMVTYQITFTESGLPSGTAWYVNLSDGQTYSSNSSTITFTEPNRSYSYTLSTWNKEYEPIQYSGLFIVNGSALSENVAFKLVTFKVTFTESGLPSGTLWYLNLSNGKSFSSSNSTVTFFETNGTYQYTIGTNEKEYHSKSGSFIVNGLLVSESVTFTEVTYNATFTETGLPSGTAWYVNISNGQTYSSNTYTIAFTEPNGSYSYTIATGNKEYRPTTYSGSFIVNGSNTNIENTFNLLTYTITFSESGLSSDTEWSVTLTNITRTSMTNTITFNEPNGTYSFVIQGISGYKANSYSGIITVNGNSDNYSVTWTVITYLLNVIVNGLPFGTLWSATLTGTTLNGNIVNVTLSSATNTITFNEPNGTYSYVVYLPSGYSGVNLSGSITVKGQLVTTNITANPPSDYTLIIIVILIVIVAVLVTILVMTRRGRKKQ